MRPEELESELLLYWIQSRELEEKGGPEQDGELFETILETEENILNSFGLPTAQKFSKILWKLAEKKCCSPKTVHKTIEKLQQTAQRYHEKPVKPSLEVLKDSLLQKLNAMDLLPELGFVTHIYTIFLYEELLLKKKAMPEDILKEMQLIHDKELYGPVANFQNNLPPNYRRTKKYKELKARLQFLDEFLESGNQVLEELTLWDEPEKVKTNNRPKAQSNIRLTSEEIEKLPESKPYYPEYKVLIGWLEIEEIIFSKEDTVTVNCLFVESHRPQIIGLGFEFEQLYQILSQYDRNKNNILNYFNYNRQRNLIDEPTIVNLKDKFGKNLPLDQHYFRVYKPKALNRNGRAEEMTEEFYLVDDILDKKTYDAEQRKRIPGTINGWFGHVKNWYYLYLSAKANGLSEKEARESINLENQAIFEISRLMYFLEKHGGKAEIKEQR